MIRVNMWLEASISKDGLEIVPMDQSKQSSKETLVQLSR